MRARLFLLMLSFLVVGVVPSAQAEDEKPTTPTGVGDLFPTPVLHSGDSKTLFETYSPTSYYLDADPGHGVTDITTPAEIWLNGLAEQAMVANIVIVRGAIAIAWWVLTATDIPSLSDAAAGMVGLASGELSGWLLPSAIALGAAIAFSQHRNASGSGLNQIAWVAVAAFLAVSFTTSPRTWVDGAENLRGLGNEAVMGATATAVSGNNSAPFEWEEPAYTGSRRDTMLRKSGDSIWRAYTVTPWCLAEFGSIEACKRYGKDILSKGTNVEKRREYIWGPMAERENGEDSATVRWTAGKTPGGRVGVLFAANIAAIIFAVLLIGLGFFSLMSYLGALLLLVAGSFFAMLWVIPGAPRRWGLAWFNQLLGLLLQTVMATLIFGAVLVLTTTVFTLTPQLGWLPVAGLSTALAFAGWRFRRVLETVTGGLAPGGRGGALMAYAAFRGLSKLMGGGKRGPGAATPRLRRQQQSAAESTSTGASGGAGFPRPRPALPPAGSRQPRGALAGPSAEGPGGRGHGDASKPGYRPNRRPGPPSGSSPRRSRPQPPAGGRTTAQPPVVQGEVIASRTEPIARSQRAARPEARTPQTRPPRQPQRPRPNRRRDGR